MGNREMLILCTAWAVGKYSSAVLLLVGWTLSVCPTKDNWPS